MSRVAVITAASRSIDVTRLLHRIDLDADAVDIAKAPGPTTGNLRRSADVRRPYEAITGRPARGRCTTRLRGTVEPPDVKPMHLEKVVTSRLIEGAR